MTFEVQPMAVVLVGGLHAEARRTTVDHLMRAVPGSVVLHHDLSTAPLGTVRRSVRDATGETSSGDVPLVNDCACCALREDLIPELERLADGRLTRLAIVELWDSVEPRGMAEVIASHGDGAFRLTNVLTAVDPSLVLPCLSNGDDLTDAGLAAAATDQRAVGDTWARQLEYAPVLVVVDSESTDTSDLALLRQLHPTAVRLPVHSGRLAEIALAGFDVAAAASAQHPACARLPHDCDEEGVSTLVWQQRRPFHPGRLYAALEDLCCAAARSRGGSGWPTGPTCCSRGTPPVARCAWRASAHGWPRCRTPPGRWCPPSAALPPRWTGTLTTATAASTSSSPRPTSTATVWCPCSTPACSPMRSSWRDPWRGGGPPASTNCSTLPPETVSPSTEEFPMPRRSDSRLARKNRPNPLDAAGITYIDYKDTDLLRKFMSDRGKIRSRRVTCVTDQQQRKVARAIKNAREMALLPYAGR